MDLNQVTVPCTDYEGTVRFYQLLGLRLIVDSPPRYARFETKKGTTFSIHAEGMASSGADIKIYFEVEDVDAEVARLRAKGVTFSGDPVDQVWLWREACAKDPSGNTVCIYHAGENRRFPPWRVA